MKTPDSLNNNDVTNDAPVFVRLEGRIDADVETVWRFISDIENWPDWNPNIRSAELDGDFVQGTRFYWKSGPAAIESVLMQIDPPRVITWSGSTMGIKAVHTWMFERSGNSTIAVTEESWDGLIARLFRWPSKRVLQKSLTKGMRYLKARSELEAGTYEPPVP